MKKHFLPTIFLAVLCMGCSGITIDLPGQAPVAPEEFNILPMPELESEPETEILFFTMPGCGPCEQVKPQLEELRRQGTKITEIDIYEHPDLGRKYQITRTPMFVVLEDGVEVQRTSSISALILILVKVLAFILPFLLA